MNPEAMNEQAIHHLYLHFQELPISRRVLYTAVLLVLGLGYLFGLVYLYASDSGRDGVPGLSVQDIVVSYSGTTEGTRLEAALRGHAAGGGTARADGQHGRAVGPGKYSWLGAGRRRA
jgi:hypothetical protein